MSLGGVVAFGCQHQNSITYYAVLFNFYVSIGFADVSEFKC